MKQAAFTSPTSYQKKGSAKRFDSSQFNLSPEERKAAQARAAALKAQAEQSAPSQAAAAPRRAVAGSAASSPAGRPVRNVAEGVFDNPVDAGLVEEFLADARHHVVVALSSGQIVGVASGVHYVHPDKPAELWINEVGVAPAVQAQGIGKQLVRALLDRGSQLGCVEAWLGTEASNTAARRLYAATGGKEEAMVYVTFPLADREEDDAS